MDCQLDQSVSSLLYKQCTTTVYHMFPDMCAYMLFIRSTQTMMLTKHIPRHNT